MYHVLKGKKWAVCGDSFTNGDFRAAIDTDIYIKEGPYAGQMKTYGYLIATENNMKVQHLAQGGRTMARPSDNSFENCFINFYKEIDKDVDYITLYFGINDSHHRRKSTGTDGEDMSGIIEFGTLDSTDETTFCGAWNVVLKYLKENYPFAHIGIIVTNGCEIPEYHLAEIALAKKWGIPYIDLNGDERTPAMIRTQNPEISDEAKELLIKNMAVNPGDNNHPNVKAHAYESTFIEAWLATI